MPLSWRENEFVIQFCCGARYCRACANHLDEEGVEARDAADKAIAEAEKTSGEDKVAVLLPAARRLKQLEHCDQCGDKQPGTQKLQLAYLERLVAAEHPDAFFTFGVWLMKGSNGMRLRPREGLEMLKAAAKLGHPLAPSGVGDMYMRGNMPELAPRDFDTARSWYELATDVNAVCQDAMGHLCQNGDGGCRRSEIEAMTWFRKSAAQGFPPGMSDFATGLYQSGQEDEALEVFIRCGSDETYIKGYRSPIANCQYHAAVIYLKRRNLTHVLGRSGQTQWSRRGPRTAVQTRRTRMGPVCRVWRGQPATPLHRIQDAGVLRR